MLWFSKELNLNSFHNRLCLWHFLASAQLVKRKFLQVGGQEARLRGSIPMWLCDARDAEMWKRRLLDRDVKRDAPPKKGRSAALNIIVDIDGLFEANDKNIVKSLIAGRFLYRFITDVLLMACLESCFQERPFFRWVQRSNHCKFDVRSSKILDVWTVALR